MKKENQEETKKDEVQEAKYFIFINKKILNNHSNLLTRKAADSVLELVEYTLRMVGITSITRGVNFILARNSNFVVEIVSKDDTESYVENYSKKLNPDHLNWIPQINLSGIFSPLSCYGNPYDNITNNLHSEMGTNCPMHNMYNFSTPKPDNNSTSSTETEKK